MKKLFPRDKQLRKLELKEVMERRRLDRALNIKQFALVAGLSYSAARYWFQQPGFPALYGVVFWNDFVEWRRACTGLATFKASQLREPVEPERQSRAELLRNLPKKAARLLAEPG